MEVETCMPLVRPLSCIKNNIGHGNGLLNQFNQMEDNISCILMGR